jgi:hypothetical protein
VWLSAESLYSQTDHVAAGREVTIDGFAAETVSEIYKYSSIQYRTAPYDYAAFLEFHSAGSGDDAGWSTGFPEKLVQNVSVLIIAKTKKPYNGIFWNYVLFPNKKGLYDRVRVSDNGVDYTGRLAGWVEEIKK